MSAVPLWNQWWVILQGELPIEIISRSTRNKTSPNFVVAVLSAGHVVCVDRHVPFWAVMDVSGATVTYYIIVRVGQTMWSTNKHYAFAESCTTGGGGVWARIVRRGGGGLGSRSVGIFIYWQAKKQTKNNLWRGGGVKPFGRNLAFGTAIGVWPGDWRSAFGDLAICKGTSRSFM